MLLESWQLSAFFSIFVMVALVGSLEGRLSSLPGNFIFLSLPEVFS